MKNRNYKIVLFMSVFLLSSLFLFSTVTFADEAELLDESNKGKVIELHKKMESVAHIDNGWMYQDVIRTIGWSFIKGQVWLVDLIEDGVRGILQFNQFYDSFGIKELMDTLTPYVLGLFLLSFIYLGYLFMTNKIDKRNEVIGNVLIALSLILAIPAMMPYLDKVMQVGVDQLDGSNKDDIMLSKSILKQNIADVKYYVDKEFNFNQLGLPIDKNAPKGQKVGSADYSKANQLRQVNIDLTEKLDLQSEEGWFGWWSSGYKKELKNNNTVGHDFLISRLVYDGDGETPRLLGLDKGKFGSDLGQQSYYRYHVNWWTIIFTFGIVAFALGITVIKMARVMFDLAFHAIFSPFVAATDLTGGQRTKKMVTEIVSSFAVLFVMVLILRIFTMYTNYVIGLAPTVGNIIAILMLVAGAWALIDAPDIVQRLLGIDAGLRSGYQALVGSLAAGKMASSGGKAISKGLGAVAKAGTGGKAFTQGLMGKQPNKPASKPIPPSGGMSPRGGGGGSVLPESFTMNDSNEFPQMGSGESYVAQGENNPSGSMQSKQDISSGIVGSQGSSIGSNQSMSNPSSSIQSNQKNATGIVDAKGRSIQSSGMQSSLSGSKQSSPVSNQMSGGGQSISGGASIGSVGGNAGGSIFPESFSMSGASQIGNASNKITESGSGFIPTGGSNPYAGHNGIRSGSVKGQQKANLQARSYNSGVAFRQKLTSGGKAIGGVAMGGAKFARNPIRSIQNVNRVVGARGSQVINSANQQVTNFGKGAKNLTSKVINESSKPIFDSKIDNNRKD